MIINVSTLWYYEQSSKIDDPEITLHNKLNWKGEEMENTKRTFQFQRTKYLFN